MEYNSSSVSQPAHTEVCPTGLRCYLLQLDGKCSGGQRQTDWEDMVRTFMLRQNSGATIEQEGKSPNDLDLTDIIPLSRFLFLPWVTLTWTLRELNLATVVIHGQGA